MVQMVFEQLLQERRVLRGIGHLVERFCAEKRGCRFSLAELEEYVCRRARCAPGSPGRILRVLRQDGRVDVRLVSRAKSLYEVAA